MSPRVVPMARPAPVKSPIAPSSLKPQYGVVTFLDILGWKGIWNRQEDPISKLLSLRDDVKNALRHHQLLFGQLSFKIGQQQPPKILNISDTLVLINSASPESVSGALDWHGFLCAAAMKSGLGKGFPIRGATAVGEFRHHETILVGKAVDEVAAWYEATDWIGVHMTPSAKYAYKPEWHMPWRKYRCPLKKGETFETYCVSWGFSELSSAAAQMAEVKRLFPLAGPILPEIHRKYENTLPFLEQTAVVWDEFLSQMGCSKLPTDKA